ncbi:hypothetical protein ISN45_Aa07g003990, partial [Arabidopsis thaliana x Arabidopsis arenosa]
ITTVFSFPVWLVKSNDKITNQTSNKFEPKINNLWNLKKSKMKSKKRIEKSEHEIPS